MRHNATWPKRVLNIDDKQLKTDCVPINFFIMVHNSSYDLWSDLFMQPASSKYDFANDFAAEVRGAWNDSEFCSNSKNLIRGNQPLRLSPGVDPGDISISSAVDSFTSLTTCGSSIGSEDWGRINLDERGKTLVHRSVELNRSSYLIPPGSRFFVIKSFNIKNVCLAIQHRVWSSTRKGNIRLEESYKNMPKGSKIYLFFSINKSGRFCGIAEMVSSIIENDPRNNIWETHTKSYRFPNLFRIHWLCIKDIEAKILGHLRWTLNDNYGTIQSISHCRDVEAIPEAVGITLIQIFLATDSSSSLLSSPIL